MPTAIRLHAAAVLSTAVLAAGLGVLLGSGPAAATPTATPSPAESVGPSAEVTPSAAETEAPAVIEEPDGSVTIAGFVWNDVDRDGLQGADEPGLPDVGLVAFNTDEVDPEDVESLMTGEKLPAARAPEPTELGEAYSDADGFYEITGLEPGEIAVLVAGGQFADDGSVSALWTITDPDVGDDDTIDSDFEPFSVLEPGEEPAEGDLAEIGDVLVEAAEGDELFLDAGLHQDDATPSPSVSEPGEGGGSGEELPNTGIQVTVFAAAGALLLGGGGAMLLASRRRRPATRGAHALD